MLCLSQDSIAAEAASYQKPAPCPAGEASRPDAHGTNISRKDIAVEAAPCQKPPRDPALLADVLRHPAIWQRTGNATRVDAQSTGFAELDASLPCGGWPRGALSELLIDEDGTGELTLLAPTLAALTRAGKRIVLIAPPYVPYAPALAAAGIDLARLVHIDARALDSHWTAEQCLRSGCCAAVINWLPQVDYRQLRRLQLAAETGAALGFVFRPSHAANQPSPAALRMRVRSGIDGPRIEILKCRGALSGHRMAVQLRA